MASPNLLVVALYTKTDNTKKKNNSIITFLFLLSEILDNIEINATHSKYIAILVATSLYTPHKIIKIV